MSFSIASFVCEIRAELCFMGSLFCISGTTLKFLYVCAQWKAEKWPSDSPLDNVHPPPKDVIDDPPGAYGVVTTGLILLGFVCISSSIIVRMLC